MKYYYPNGATPLNLDEMNGLIPTHITTQADLNEWEAINILNAEKWLFNKPVQKNILTMNFLKLLHKKMFSDTWKWAGIFRYTEKNIGVHQSQITTEIQKLLDDVDIQIQYQSYLHDEIAFRFHHRLVYIHPFANGNGRHARMMTDALLLYLKQSPFTWGRQKLEAEGPVRQQYIDALRKADKHDYRALRAFVRS